MGHMQFDTLNPTNFQEGERVFDPKHPEKSRIKISVEADSRISGSIHVGRLLVECLMNGGYANVFKSGPCESASRVTFDNLEVATLCGTDPGLKDLQKKVTIEVHTTAPNSRDFELSFVEAMVRAEHGARITREEWNNSQVEIFVVRSDYVEDKELRTWNWSAGNLQIALAERQRERPVYYQVHRFKSNGRTMPTLFTANSVEIAMHDWKIAQ